MKLVRDLLILTTILALVGAFHPPGHIALPKIFPAHGSQTGGNVWYPAGPSMDTLYENIFTSPSDEYSNLESAQPSIDFPDSPIPAGLLGTSDPFLHSLLYNESSPQRTGFSEIEFNMANNFWGCNFNFGDASSTCGKYIRQGIAHLIDKASFAVNEPDLAGQAVAIDNPLSPAATLPTPNPCNWDSHFVEQGSNCIVGSPGGTAYHLGTSSGASIGQNSYQWMQANPSPDFCAGAWDIAVGVSSIMPSEPPPGIGVNMVQPPGGGFPNTAPSTWTYGPGTNCALVPCCANSASSQNLVIAAQTIGAHPIDFYYGDGNNALLLLGETLAAEICAVWNNGFTNGCSSVCLPNYPQSCMPILNVHNALSPVYFPGYTTSTGSNPNSNWGMWTAGSGYYLGLDPYLDNTERISTLVQPNCTPTGCDPFDDNLFFTFNSRYVSGISSIVSPTGPCSINSIPNGSAPDYMYLCNVPYDTISNKMEYSPCLSATGDPSNGQTSNSPGANCANTNQLSAVSAGVQAEDLFGSNAYTIPIFSQSVEYAYLSGWNSGVINAGGTFNYFTFLNAWSKSPGVPGTIRVGLSQSQGSLDPYLASTPSNFAVLSDIYDSLISVDPYNQGAAINWMTISTQQLPNTSLTYAPPAGTQQTFRFTLRSDLFFQDGRKVTTFDVAFSYLTLLLSGSILGGTLQNMVGVTILSPTQMDVNVNSYGPFTQLSLGASPVLPGAYWTNVGSSVYTAAISACTATNAPCYPIQYALSASGIVCAPQGSTQCNTFPAAYMAVNPNFLSVGFDPIINRQLVGSGPWTCGVVTSSGSDTSCSTAGSENPPVGGGYLLSRFGKGMAPGSSISSIYFRSNGNLATYLWSLDTGDLTHDFLNFSVVAGCFGAAVTSTGPCTHFQQGIGANGGPIPVGLSQVAIVNRFLGVNWIAPFGWTTSPPNGMGLPNVVLHEGTFTLNPSSVVGCASPYPKGGYDC